MQGINIAGNEIYVSTLSLDGYKDIEKVPILSDDAFTFMLNNLENGAEVYHLIPKESSKTGKVSIEGRPIFKTDSLESALGKLHTLINNINSDSKRQDIFVYIKTMTADGANIAKNYFKDHVFLGEGEDISDSVRVYH